jgi:hypothetical protein
MPPATRVRAGAPATINIAEGDMAVYVSATPFLWLGPILARIVPTEMQTADLCATPPPPPEMWTMQDVLGGLTDGPNGFIDQKLFRMGQAAVWPTYCEYVPPEDPAPGQLPRFLGKEFPGPTLLRQGQKLYYNVQYPEADFWLLTSWFEEWGGDYWPRFSALVGWFPNGDRGPDVLAYAAPNTTFGPEDTTKVWCLARGMVGTPYTPPYPAWNVSGTSTTLQPDTAWTYEWPGTFGQPGRIWFTLTAWALDGVPHVRPWPPAPPIPPELQPVGQFTDQAVADLTAMAAASAERWASLWTTLDGLHPPEGAQQIGAPESLPAGTSTWPRPANAIGFAVQLAAPTWMGRGGTNPTAYTALGWLTESSMLGDHPSVRIKHEYQVLTPLGQDADSVKVDLADGVTGSYVWLQPGPVG